MHYFVFLSTSSKAIDLFCLTGISPHLFDLASLYIPNMVSSFEQNLILKQAFPFHPHPPALPIHRLHEIEFSSIVEE
jgi:hypothetical protein